jgi:hypothetical protein
MAAANRAQLEIDQLTSNRQSELAQKAIEDAAARAKAPLEANALAISNAQDRAAASAAAGQDNAAVAGEITATIQKLQTKYNDLTTMALNAKVLPEKERLAQESEVRRQLIILVQEMQKAGTGSSLLAKTVRDAFPGYFDANGKPLAPVSTFTGSPRGFNADGTPILSTNTVTNNSALTQFNKDIAAVEKLALGITGGMTIKQLAADIAKSLGVSDIRGKNPIGSGTSTSTKIAAITAKDGNAAGSAALKLGSQTRQFTLPDDPYRKYSVFTYNGKTYAIDPISGSIFNFDSSNNILGSVVKDRKKMYTGGKVSGPGTATSDSIPAMLSDGEYVFSAKAVDAAGGPDVVDNWHKALRRADGGPIYPSWKKPKSAYNSKNQPTGSPYGRYWGELERLYQGSPIGFDKNGKPIFNNDGKDPWGGVEIPGLPFSGKVGQFSDYWHQLAEQLRKSSGPGMGIDKITPPLIGSGASAMTGGLLGGGGGNMLGYADGGLVKGQSAWSKVMHTAMKAIDPFKFGKHSLGYNFLGGKEIANVFSGTGKKSDYLSAALAPLGGFGRGAAKAPGAISKLTSEMKSFHMSDIDAKAMNALSNMDLSSIRIPETGISFSPAAAKAGLEALKEGVTSSSAWEIVQAQRETLLKNKYPKIDFSDVSKFNEYYAKEFYGLLPDDAIKLFKGVRSTTGSAWRTGEKDLATYFSTNPHIAALYSLMIGKAKLGDELPMFGIDRRISDLRNFLGEGAVRNGNAQGSMEFPQLLGGKDLSDILPSIYSLPGQVYGQMFGATATSLTKIKNLWPKGFHDGGPVGHKHKASLPQHLLDMTRTASMSNLAPHNMGMQNFGKINRLNVPHDMGMGKTSEDPYYQYNYRLPKFTDNQKPESLPKFALNQLKTLVDGKIPPLSAFSVLKNFVQRFESRETGAGVDTYAPEEGDGENWSPASIHVPYYQAQKGSGYGKLKPVYLDVKDYTSEGKKDRKRNLASIYMAANELTKLTGVPFRVLKPENRNKILERVALNPYTSPKVIPIQFLEKDRLREERGGSLIEAGWWARNAGTITLPRAKQSDTWMGFNPFSTAGGKDVAMHEIIHSFQGHLDGNEECPMCSTTKSSWLDRHLGGAQGNHSLNPFNIMNMYGFMGGGVSNDDIESIRKQMGYYQYKTDLTPEEIKLIERKIQVSKGSRFANGGLAQNFSNSALTNLGVPMFKNGINMVPADMLALIHKNEAVVPANMNPFNPNASAAVSGSVYNINVELNGTTVTAKDVALEIRNEMRIKEMAAGVNRTVGRS